MRSVNRAVNGEADQKTCFRDCRFGTRITLVVWLACVTFALLALSLATFVQAQTRVDLFDKRSNRTGYILVDPKSERIDTYDTKSNRTGYGYITPSGRVDLSDAKSNRTGYGRVSPAPGAPGR